MINNLLSKVYSLFSSSKKKEDKNFNDYKQLYDNLGDHIIVALSEDSKEPYIKIVITEDGDSATINSFANMVDDLNSGLFLASMISILGEIGQSNPPMRNKIRQIAVQWEALYKTRTVAQDKSQPLIKPTSFSQRGQQ